MSKKSRVNWFKVKLLCQNLSLKIVAKELNITVKELFSLIEGQKQNTDFTKWVVKNFGKPYWL
jgi:hypothetical protein